MIELSAQAIFLQDSHGCAVPFDPDDLAARDINKYWDPFIESDG